MAYIGKSADAPETAKEIVSKVNELIIHTFKWPTDVRVNALLRTGVILALLGEVTKEQLKQALCLLVDQAEGKHSN